MPGSVTSAFSESEDFEAALRAEGCRGLLITGRGPFRARLTQITLLALRLSATKEQLSRIAFVSVPADTVLITFPLDGGSSLICGGIASRSGEMGTLSPGEQAHIRTDGPFQGGAIWLPINELVRYCGALTGAPFAMWPAVTRLHPPVQAGRHLRGLHAAATRMASSRPQALVDCEAAHGLEQQLIHAIVECLAGGSADGDYPIEAPPPRHHGQIRAAASYPAGSGSAHEGNLRGALRLTAAAARPLRQVSGHGPNRLRPSPANVIGAPRPAGRKRRWGERRRGRAALRLPQRRPICR